MVVVTGSSGFIGSALVKSFGPNAIGLQRSKNTADAINIYRCDLLNKRSVEKTINEIKIYPISHIIHTAAVTPWAKQNNYGLDLVMAKEVLEIANHLKVPKIVFLSGWNVYDSKGALPISEDSKTNPIDPYGLSKLNVEKLLLSNRNGVQILNLRVASLYGPGQFSKGLIPNLVGAALDGRRLVINSPGTKRDYMYIEDFVHGIQNIIAKKTLKDYKYMNIGSGHSVSILNVAQAIKTIFQNKYEINVQIEVHKGEPSIPMDNLLDIKRARREKIIDTYTPIEEGLMEYISWRKNEDIL